MNRGILVVLCALLPALSQPAFTEESGTSKAAPPVDAELTVSAVRKLTEMRKEIALAEDRFVAKYNELNKERQYAIKCNDETYTGSRLNRRMCRPEFVADATGDETRGWLRGEVYSPASPVIATKNAGFRKNMLDIASKNPELVKLAQQHDDLEKRYNELLRHTLTGNSPNE